LTLTQLGSTDTTWTPKLDNSVNIVDTSLNWGTRLNWQVSPVNSVAASIGKAAFFEPEAAKFPSRRVPPTIIKLCKVHSLVIGQSGGACLNIHRMQRSVGY
jgi:hypothetical protein